MYFVYEKESHTVLERHEGEQLMTGYSFLVKYPFNNIFKYHCW